MYSLTIIDRFLNSVTMYKLVLYGLLILSGVSILLGFGGVLSFSGYSLLISLLVFVGSCGVLNFIFSKIWQVPANVESWLITALILFLIILPSTSFSDIKIVILASFLAIASKYIITFRRKHIFNPVAFSAVVLGLLGIGNTLWWVGSIYLLPVVLVVGLLVVRKTRRFSLFLAFLVASVISLVAVHVYRVGTFSGFEVMLWQNISSWPLIFFGTIMLTEPSTLPPTKKGRTVYGLAVGVLFAIPFHFGILFSTPELALVIGNILSYGLCLKRRLKLVLESKQEIAQGIYEFVFSTSHIPYFKAGQYFEITLPMNHRDIRGNRRYFTIASSPTEDKLRIGIRISPNGSAFKKDLREFALGETVFAGHISGDFVLPQDTNKKLVFIAGGIGITPFRSMVKYMIDTKNTQKTTLFYCVKKPEEIAYKNIFEDAKNAGFLNFVPVVSEKDVVWEGEYGYINKEMIERHVSDCKTCLYYLSGPSAMVDSYKKILLGMGVLRKDIQTDYFPGL